MFPTNANEEYCYLTTKGRVTGKPHLIEIWFGLDGTTLYMLSGGGKDSDWVKNLIAEPAVSIRIGKQNIPAIARLVTDKKEDTLARRMLAAKYYHWREGQPMEDWATTALPIAFDFGIS